jgi:hypothetical protein
VVTDAHDANPKTAGCYAEIVADCSVIRARCHIADQLPIGGVQQSPDLFELDAGFDGRGLIDDRRQGRRVRATQARAVPLSTLGGGDRLAEVQGWRIAFGTGKNCVKILMMIGAPPSSPSNSLRLISIDLAIMSRLIFTEHSRNLM